MGTSTCLCCMALISNIIWTAEKQTTSEQSTNDGSSIHCFKNGAMPSVPTTKPTCSKISTHMIAKQPFSYHNAANRVKPANKCASDRFLSVGLEMVPLDMYP